MPIKLYTEPTPAPKSVVHPYKPRDPASRTSSDELVFDGPTLEEWTQHGYDPARYPGQDAFMRRARRHDQEHAITAEREPVAPAHDIGDDPDIKVTSE